VKEINWFPGHMAKSRRELLGSLKRADLILEVCDARLPKSSRHPDLDKISEGKPVWTILGKSDLADPVCTDKWLCSAEAENKIWLALNLFSDRELNQLRKRLRDYNEKFLVAARAKGQRISPLRLIIVGIPNTGKSTLINRLIGKKSTQTSNRPGVTRSLRWVRGGTDYEILDTPGILPPRLNNKESKLNLAAAGAIPDDILPLDEVAFALFKKLLLDYPALMEQRFAVTNGGQEEWELFQMAACKRNCLASGGKADLPRFINLLLREFRTGKIGRISLECPPFVMDITE